ncbi:MAG: hypothetical protein LBL45_12575 [Treponema sp.]|nr:hypothetical protein [Treponema sp.]
MTNLLWYQCRLGSGALFRDKNIHKKVTDAICVSTEKLRKYADLPAAGLRDAHAYVAPFPAAFPKAGNAL